MDTYVEISTDNLEKFLIELSKDNLIYNKIIKEVDNPSKNRNENCYKWMKYKGCIAKEIF